MCEGLWNIMLFLCTLPFTTPWFLNVKYMCVPATLLLIKYSYEEFHIAESYLRSRRWWNCPAIHHIFLESYMRITLLSNNPSLVRIVNYFSPAYLCTPYFFHKHYNVILPYMFFSVSSSLFSWGIKENG